MIDWITSLVPWWAYLIIAAIAIGAVWRLLGWQGALVAAAGAIAALGYGKGRAEGKSIMEAEQQRKRDALQQEYDRIDAGPVNVGAAYQRMRKRAGRG